MNLETALGVKRELEAVFPTRTRDGRGRKFAFGVATPVSSDDYRVAIRAASADDVPEETLEAIRRQTANELDVRIVGPIRASGAHTLATSRGAAIGASVAHSGCTAGTLGFFASRRDGTVGFVSNNHVLAAEDRGKDGDEIYHPAPADGGRGAKHVIGHLMGGYPKLNQAKVTVDCAFARIARGRAYDAGSLDGDKRIQPQAVLPYAKPEVCKIGRTTGLTFGRVSAFELDPEVHYLFGPRRCRGQIEIESTTLLPFSLGGDSGSLVYTRDCEPVGLLFAASAIGGRNNCGLSYANPIGAVLDALDLTLLT